MVKPNHSDLSGPTDYIGGSEEVVRAEYPFAEPKSVLASCGRVIDPARAHDFRVGLGQQSQVGMGERRKPE